MRKLKHCRGKINPIKSNVITLEDKLNDIYGSVDLRSTCCKNLTCCKTGCPQMHFSEFSSLINKVWETSSKSEKIDLICASIEYFFKTSFETWGMESMIKKCLLLDENEKRCKYYEFRPLSCRIYGLWPKDVYEARVDKFENAYEGMLKREELPLNTQCPYVKRVDESKPLTEEVINGLFRELTDLDSRMGNFSKVQLDLGENYRTFHDWLLLKVFGEQFLCSLTEFLMAANKDLMIDQIIQLKKAIVEKFSKESPNIN